MSGEETQDAGPSPARYAVGRFVQSALAQADAVAVGLPVEDLMHARMLLEKGAGPEALKASNGIQMLLAWGEHWLEVRGGDVEEEESGD